MGVQYRCCLCLLSHSDVTWYNDTNAIFDHARTGLEKIMIFLNKKSDFLFKSDFLIFFQKIPIFEIFNLYCAVKHQYTL